MLFIDSRRQVRSVTEAHIPVPFVRESFRRDLWRVRMLFGLYRYDPLFIKTLADEVTGLFGSVPRALPYPASVINVAERAIADGVIRVASALPQVAVLTFDRDHSLVPSALEAVMFANSAVAADFLTVVLRNATNQSVLATALKDAAGYRYARVMAGEHLAGLSEAWPDGEAELAQRVAALLVRRCLALLPQSSQQVLRLAWLEHRVPSVVDEASLSSPAAPRSARTLPSPAAEPMSVLPDPPAVMSSQAHSLIEAAKHGLPFCEECARQAEQASV